MLHSIFLECKLIYFGYSTPSIWKKLINIDNMESKFDVSWENQMKEYNIWTKFYDGLTMYIICGDLLPLDSGNYLSRKLKITKA